jgi:hypothetical protein
MLFEVLDVAANSASRHIQLFGCSNKTLSGPLPQAQALIGGESHSTSGSD